MQKDYSYSTDVTLPFIEDVRSFMHYIPNTGYSVELAKAIGIKPAILFDYILRQTPDESGAMPIPVKSVTNETALTVSEQMAALRILEDGCFIDTPFVMGLPAKRFIRLSFICIGALKESTKMYNIQ